MALLCWLSAVVLLVVGALRTPTERGDDKVHKQDVTVCNAFADVRPASITVQPLHRPSAEAEGFFSSANALWAHTLAYGSCEEYHIDLSHRRLVFTSPGNAGECEVHRPDLGEVVRTREGRLAAAVSQKAAGLSSCTVHWVAERFQTLVPANSSSTSLLKPAELMVVDAFTKEEGPRTHELEEVLPELDAGNVVRLEDKIQHDTIAVEVVGSRTLGMGQSYAVEPKELHVVLEDMSGSRVFDWRDVDFKSGREYVAVRMGRAGDAAFPPKLLVHECQESDG